MELKLLFTELLKYTDYVVLTKDIELDEDKSVTKTEDKKSNTFENVKYKGLYDFNKPFTVESETAFILLTSYVGNILTIIKDSSVTIFSNSTYSSSDTGDLTIMFKFSTSRR